MAVIEGIPGVRVLIYKRGEGEPYVEYTDPSPGAQKPQDKVTKYIEVVAGDEFSINFMIDGETFPNNTDQLQYRCWYNDECLKVHTINPESRREGYLDELDAYKWDATSRGGHAKGDPLVFRDGFQVRPNRRANGTPSTDLIRLVLKFVKWGKTHGGARDDGDSVGEQTPDSLVKLSPEPKFKKEDEDTKAGSLTPSTNGAGRQAKSKRRCTELSTLGCFEFKCRDKAEFKELGVMEASAIVEPAEPTAEEDDENEETENDHPARSTKSKKSNEQAQQQSPETVSISSDSDDSDFDDDNDEDETVMPVSGKEWRAAKRTRTAEALEEAIDLTTEKARPAKKPRQSNSKKDELVDLTES